ncbi:hypothetical protein KP2269_51650 [Klebsiella pneumoniae]|nr:hypothetical protein KP2269_51650 [Klebsiella pneumoniae]
MGIRERGREAHLAFFKDRSEIGKGKMQIAGDMDSGSLLLAPAVTIVEAYLLAGKKVVRFLSAIHICRFRRT